MGHPGEQRIYCHVILPSLLRVFAYNRDNGVKRLRLFESAATFARLGTSHREAERVALVTDLPRVEEGLRPIRGVAERLIRMLLGNDVTPEVVPEQVGWLSPAAVVRAGRRTLGYLGVIAPQIQRMFQLDEPVAAAELDLPPLYDRYPPETEAQALPSFPPVERDISPIVDGHVQWIELRGVVDALHLDHLEAIEFVSTFRGKPMEADKKSVTMRLRFRAPDRTLQHESVDEQVAAVIAALESKLEAHIRR